MDASAQIGLFAFLGTAVTTLGIIYVAIINSKRERVDTADAGVEGTLRERILLRDERIADYERDNAVAQMQIAQQTALVAQRDVRIGQLKAEVKKLKSEREGLSQQ